MGLFTDKDDALPYTPEQAGVTKTDSPKADSPKAGPALPASDKLLTADTRPVIPTPVPYDAPLMATPPCVIKTGSYMLRGGGYKVAGTVEATDAGYFLRFGYNPSVIDAVKNFDDRQWKHADKTWFVPRSERNDYRLAHMIGAPVFAKFDAVPFNVQPKRKLMSQQVTMFQMGMTRRTMIWASEMGTGKTLAAIELMEASSTCDWWWVGPKRTLPAIEREFNKWGLKIRPKMMGYEEFAITMKTWASSPPKGIIFDEASKLKNWSALRTKAAAHLTREMRRVYGNPYIILMTGTPAPKSPLDWWSLAEIARPGFLIEGNLKRFIQRMQVVESRMTVTGAAYPHAVGFRDSEDKCYTCNLLKDDMIHDTVAGSPPHGSTTPVHEFQPGVNEVSHLYKRLKGLVFVCWKRDCMDLPEKRYEIIQCKPSDETMRLLRFVLRTTDRAAQALVLARELSDGFQYREETHPTNLSKCPGCNGGGKEMDMTVTTSVQPTYVICSRCDGKGQIPQKVRTTVEVATPKDNALKELLVTHEEVGRIVICGGFTGTIDRVNRICQAEGWNTIVLDGRGYNSTLGTNDAVSLLKIFQDSPHDADDSKCKPIAFIIQPSSGGMGLTLTRSPSVVYFSNDFNGESRIQSEDRIHRPGMDTVRGATIYDIIHLPTDLYVLEKLKAKADLQALSMGEMSSAMKINLTETGRD